MPRSVVGPLRDSGATWVPALAAKLARAARARRQAHAAFALLLGLAAAAASAAALLASGLALWPDRDGAFEFAAGQGPWPLALCLMCGLVCAAAFWVESRLDALGLADALDRAEGHGGELRTAFELYVSRPDHPLLPALCRRLLARSPGAQRWRALSPPAWLGLLPLLLSSALLLEALGPRDRAPAGLPELLAGGAARLEEASSLAAAEALRNADQTSPAARGAQADLARVAVSRAQSAFQGAALRAKEPRSRAELAARIEEAEARLTELEASRFAVGQAAGAIAEARARLDAARLLVAGGVGPRSRPGAGSPGRPGDGGQRPREAGPADAVGPGSGPAESSGEPQASGGVAADPAGVAAAGPTAGALAQGGVAAPSPSDPEGDDDTAPGRGTSARESPAAGASPSPGGPASATAGPVIGASEAPVVAAWVELQARPGAF